mgnify:CR=1 FL=1
MWWNCRLPDFIRRDVGHVRRHFGAACVGVDNEVANREVERAPELIRRLEERYGEELSPARLKLAEVPAAWNVPTVGAR